MTVAVDKKTGAVVGQVTAVRELPNGTLTGITVLTKDGYKDLPPRSVRLEEA